MKAITMGAEYAAAVAAGRKSVETRGRRCNHRGEVGIHAGMSCSGLPRGWQRGEEGGAYILDGAMYVGASGSGPFWYPTDGSLPHQRLHLGAIVATAQLVDCVPIVAERGCNEVEAPEGGMVTISADGTCLTRFKWSDTFYGRKLHSLREWSIQDQLPYGTYEPGRWALILEDVRPLPEPVPATGKQAVPWTVPDDVAARVREQLAAA